QARPTMIVARNRVPLTNPWSMRATSQCQMPAHRTCRGCIVADGPLTLGELSAPASSVVESTIEDIASYSSCIRFCESDEYSSANPAPVIAFLTPDVLLRTCSR